MSFVHRNVSCVLCGGTNSPHARSNMNIVAMCTIKQKVIRVCHVDNMLLIVQCRHNDNTYEELDFNKCCVPSWEVLNNQLQKFACWIRHVGLSICNNNSRTAQRIRTFIKYGDMISERFSKLWRYHSRKFYYILAI